MKDIQNKTNFNSPLGDGSTNTNLVPLQGLGVIFLFFFSAVVSASGAAIFQSWGKSYGLVSDIQRSTDSVYKIYKKGLSEYQKSWL